MFVALPAANHVTLPIFEAVLYGTTIVGTRTDPREVFELQAAGKTMVIREISTAPPRQPGDRRRRDRPRGRQDVLAPCLGAGAG